jgi:hypothetical protein
MKTLKLLFTLGVVAVLIYSGWQLVPPFFYNYQFQDALDNEARIDSYTNTRTEDDIKNSIVKKAEDLEIPLTANQVQVQRLPNNVIYIEANYSVHVSLPGYPLDLQFKASSKNKPL